MNNITTLNKLKINHTAQIYKINCDENINRRLLDLGIVKNTLIRPVFKSTGGDPTAYEIRGTTLAIRNQDADKIEVILQNNNSKG